MPLPTTSELREMLEYASPHPWQKEWGFITPSEREPDRLLADLGGAYGDVYPRKEDTDLMLIAPQLAEEVIRLREEIAGIKRFCRDGMEVYEAEARLTDHEEEKAWREGRRAAYYDIYRQITQGHRRENKEGDDK